MCGDPWDLAQPRDNEVHFILMFIIILVLFFFHYKCSYGLCFPDSSSVEFCKKSTKVITTLSNLKQLEKKCPGICDSHKHVAVWGSIDSSLVPSGSPTKRATLAGAYPSSLCARWASLIAAGRESGERPFLLSA